MPGADRTAWPGAPCCAPPPRRLHPGRCRPAAHRAWPILAGPARRPWAARRQSRICVSTRSAVRRSASSRSAIKLPLLKEIGRRLLRLPGYRPCPRPAAPAAHRAADPPPPPPRRRRTGCQAPSPDAHAVMPPTTSVPGPQVLHVHRAQTSMPAASSSSIILPALGVARARGVAVRQLVEQHQRRLGLGPPAPPACAAPKASAASRSNSLSTRSRQGTSFERQQRQTGQQRLGLGAAMGFHQADDQVAPLRPRRVGGAGAWSQVLPTPADAPKKSSNARAAPAPPAAARAPAVRRVGAQVVGVNGVGAGHGLWYARLHCLRGHRCACAPANAPAPAAARPPPVPARRPGCHASSAYPWPGLVYYCFNSFLRLLHKA